MQHLKQQPAVEKKHARAKAAAPKAEDARQTAERGVEALGGKAQRNAVGRGKSVAEAKAPEVQQDNPSHEEGASVGAATCRPSEEDVRSKDTAQTTTPSLRATPPKEGNLDDAQSEGASAGSAIGGPSHDAKDASVGATSVSRGTWFTHWVKMVSEGHHESSMCSSV